MSKKICSIILSLILILQALPAFADAAPEVVSHALYDSSNVQLSLMSTGERAKFEMTINDSGVKTNEIANKEAIDVISLAGCFGSSPTVSKRELLSSGSEPLNYKLTFDQVVYTGGNPVISFKIKYRGTAYTSDTVTLRIDECNIAGEGDVITSTDSSGNTTYTVPAPPIDINRGEMKTVEPGEEFEVELLLKNRGVTSALDPVVNISASGDIYPAGSSSYYVPDIKAGATHKLKVRFRAEEKIATASQQFTVTVKYQYNSGSQGKTNSEETSMITVPAKVQNTTGSPVIQITRGNLAPLEADKTAVVPVTVKNLGDIDAKDVVVNITSDDGLMVTSSVTDLLGDIPAKSQKNFNIDVKTVKDISDNYKNLNVEIKYNYLLNRETQNGESSVKFPIQLVPNNKDSSAPLIQLTYSGLGGTLNANSSFSFTITAKNTGREEILNSMLNIEGSEDIIITPSTSSFAFNGLKPGESKSFTVRAKTVKKLTSASQTLNAELKYNYKSDKTYSSGNESLKIHTALNYEKEDEKMKSSTPNVIIENYSYGTSSIPTGENFILEIGFKNKGSVPVQNLTMTLEPSEAIAITTGTNTFYYENIGAGQGGVQKIQMYALPNSDKSSSTVNVNFKYEYVADKQRSEATSTQSVSIPLYKPDLMEFTPPTMQTPGIVGEDYPFSIEYVNKGKGEVCNVRAELLGDVDTVQRIQNLGNFEAGKSGNINFIVKPTMPGKNEVSVKITYEDANLKQKERIFNLSYDADEEMLEDFGEDFDMEEEKPSGTWKKPAAIGGGIAAAVIAAIIIIRKRKKKKDSFKVNWED